MGTILLPKYSDITTLDNKIGTLTSLNTTPASTVNLVSAINSINTLSMGTLIAENADLNDYITPGVYYATAEIANTLSNSYNTHGGSYAALKMTVEQYPHGGIRQNIVASTGYSTYFRNYDSVNEVWSEWKSKMLVHEDDSPQGPQIYLYNDQADITASLSDRTSTSYTGIRCKDQNGIDIGVLYNGVTKDQKSYTGVWAYNYNSSGTRLGGNSFFVGVDKSGDPYYYFDNKDAAWHAVDNYATSSSTANISLSSGITLNSISCKTYGGIGMLAISFTHSSSWTSGSTYSVGTVVAAYRPVQNIKGSSYSSNVNLEAHYTSAGAILGLPRANRSANTREYVAFPCYILSTRP